MRPISGLTSCVPRSRTDVRSLRYSSVRPDLDHLDRRISRRAFRPRPRASRHTGSPTVDRLYLNAFAMACVGHQSAGLWRHPEDRGYRYTDLDHWVQLARTLDEGGFDALFLADVLGIYDVYGGSR